MYCDSVPRDGLYCMYSIETPFCFQVSGFPQPFYDRSYRKVQERHHYISLRGDDALESRYHLFRLKTRPCARTTVLLRQFEPTVPPSLLQAPCFWIELLSRSILAFPTLAMLSFPSDSPHRVFVSRATPPPRSASSTTFTADDALDCSPT